jgi:Fe2+ transport system protein FeoA
MLVFRRFIVPGIERLEEAFALTSLADGESGRIVAFNCGREALGKLESMGILVGVEIEKRSSSLRRGPVVVGKGRVQVALAFAIAKGILVERLGPRAR